MGDDPDEMRHRLRALADDGEGSPTGGITQMIAMAQWAAEAEWVASMEPYIDHDEYLTDRADACSAARRWAIHASEAELADTLAGLPGKVAGVIADQRCPADAARRTWDLDGVVRDVSDVTGRPVERRRHVKRVKAAATDRSLLVDIVVGWFEQAIDERRSELGGRILAEVTRRVALNALDRHWRVEARRLLQERTGIEARPQSEYGPATAFARWAAPPVVDLDNDLVAHDVLRDALRATVTVR